MLSNPAFLDVVDAAPLVAMDLVVVRGDSDVLLGLRNNRPAQGFWFVPGGRIRKNESMQAAQSRIALQELGLHLDALAPPRHIGVFEHLYTDCFAGDIGVSTHYVVMGNLVLLPAGAHLPVADTQHAELRWWSLDDARTSDIVHRYTKDYLDVIEVLLRE